MLNFFKRTPRTKARFMNHEVFKTEVLDMKKPTLLTFSASWCGACKMQKPLIHDVAHHHKDENLLIGIVDVDNQSKLSHLFGIKSIPTTIAFQNGEPVFKKKGIMTRKQLEDLVDTLTQTK